MLNIYEVVWKREDSIKYERDIITASSKKVAKEVILRVEMDIEILNVIRICNVNGG